MSKLKPCHIGSCEVCKYWVDESNKDNIGRCLYTAYGGKEFMLKIKPAAYHPEASIKDICPMLYTTKQHGCRQCEEE
jgi:hypothetical protein